MSQTLYGVIISDSEVERNRGNYRMMNKYFTEKKEAEKFALESAKKDKKYHESMRVGRVFNEAKEALEVERMTFKYHVLEEFSSEELKNMSKEKRDAVIKKSIRKE